MSEWGETTLGEVTDTLLGKTLTRGGGAEGEPYLRNVNVQWGHIGLDGLNRMQLTHAEREKYQIREGDLLVCEGGEVGRCALVRKDLEGVYFQNALHRVRVRDPRILLPEFLAFWLEHHVRQGGLDGLTTKVTIAHLNQTKLRGLPIPLPPLAEQRRIVDVMAAVDAQIEALANEVANTTDLYEVFLRDLSDRFDPAKIGSVVTQVFAGGTPSRKRADYFGGDIPWLKSGEVDDDRIVGAAETITDAGLKGSSAKLVPAGATVIAMYGQGDTKGRAGFVASPVTTNQAVLALVPDPARVDSRFLLHAVRSQTTALRARAVGAAQPNLSKGLVVSHEIPIPSDIATQKTLAAAADGMVAVRTAAQAELATLRTFRSTLLTALLSQQIEIPESYDSLLEAVS